MNAISAKNLSKNFKIPLKEVGFKGTLRHFLSPKYQTKSAVSNFDLEIPKGEIIGLLGPNGAGKTTLMKMFTGIVIPSAGTLEILGENPWKRKKEFRQKIALVMGQKSQLWWDISAMDSFNLLQSYYEIPSLAFKKKLDAMAEMLDVQDLMGTLMRKLSLGERMKMELMASLLHSPDIIFLDEPTIGLDLVAQENMREFILNYHLENKATIVITSHYMADVQALCSRLVLIMKGEKTFDGPIKKFESILGREKLVTFSFDQPVHNQEYFQNLDPSWKDCHTQVDCRIPEENLREVCAQIFQNFPVTEFHTEKIPIERVMKTLMENPKLLSGQLPT